MIVLYQVFSSSVCSEESKELFLLFFLLLINTLLVQIQLDLLYCYNSKLSKTEWHWSMLSYEMFNCFLNSTQTSKYVPSFMCGLLK